MLKVPELCLKEGYNNYNTELPSAIWTGPLDVINTGFSSDASAKSPLSSFSLISASWLLSLSEKIPLLTCY
jgi:hypothetical protein